MYQKEIILKHFDNVSTYYDKNNQKLYWKLADNILWKIIKKYIPKDKSFTILELGAGTGEWAYKILSRFNNTEYILVDFSNKMLEKARQKLVGFNSRTKFIKADINNLNLSKKVDMVLNIYVLPFFPDADKLISISSLHLKIGGILISVGENYYNGLALNILKSNIEEVKSVYENSEGKLSSSVPMLHFNKINELENIYKQNNIKSIYKCGYPVLSLIGVEESLTTNRFSIRTILENNFDYIFNLEMEYIKDVNLCNRGKYICLVGEKNEESSDIKRN